MKSYKKIFFLHVAVLTGMISFAGSGVKAQSVTWQKVLNYTDNSGLSKAHQTSDGGFIAVGSSRIVGNNKIFLVKLNIYGDTLWNKYFDLNVNAVYSGFWVEETFDKGFIVAGTGQGTGSDAYLVKTDSSGNIQWFKTFGGSEIDQGRCVKQLKDGGFILMVRTVSYTNTNDIMLIRINSAGNEIWRKIYGNSSNQELGMEARVIGNSGYIIAGWIKFGNQPTSLYLIRTNINGDSLWTKTYHSFSTSAAYSIDLSNDNGFIIGGIADSTNDNFRRRWCSKKFAI